VSDPGSVPGALALHGRDDARVEQIMGMPIVIDARGVASGHPAVEAAFGSLRDADRVFSTYRPESDVCRLNRGEITLAEAHPDVADVLRRCSDAAALTDGYFDIRGLLPRSAAEPDPVDPSGLVKGWAVQRAGAILDAAGLRTWCINAGGDVAVRGHPEPDEGWRVGIRHPLEHERVAAVVEVEDAAVATSGAYERGDHVLDPHTRRPPEGVLSVTILGPDLVLADVLATSVFARGRDGAAWAAGLDGYEAMVITTDLRVLTTAGFAAYRVA